MNNLTKELIKVRKHLGPRTGICAAYKQITGHSIINHLDFIDWAEWEHYSGDKNYPIAGRGAYLEEHVAKTIHLNPRRYQLIDWMIEQSKVRWRVTKNGLYFKGYRLPIELNDLDADIGFVRTAFDLTPASLWVRKFVAESPGTFRAVALRQDLASGKEMFDKYREQKNVRYHMNSFYL